MHFGSTLTTMSRPCWAMRRQVLSSSFAVMAKPLKCRLHGRFSPGHKMALGAVARGRQHY